MDSCFDFDTVLYIGDIVEFHCFDVLPDGQGYGLVGVGILKNIEKNPHRESLYCTIAYHNHDYGIYREYISNVFRNLTPEQLLTHSTPEVRALALQDNG